MAQVIKRGPGFIARDWSDEVFWAIALGSLVLLYVLMRLVPAARLTEQAVTSWSYPFRVPWAEVKQFRRTSIQGAPYVKVYGQRSRFAIWVPLHATAREQIRMFIGAIPSAEGMRAALDDQRSN